MKFLLLTLLGTFPLLIFSQLGTGQTPSQRSVTSELRMAKESFDKFCQKHALYVLPGNKVKQVEFDGSLTLTKSLNYKDYNLTLQDQKTQYFKVEGSDQVAVLQSVTRLRAQYNDGKNK